MKKKKKTLQDSTSYNKFFKGCVFVQGDEKNEHPFGCSEKSKCQLSDIVVLVEDNTTAQAISGFFGESSAILTA